MHVRCDEASEDHRKRQTSSERVRANERAQVVDGDYTSPNDFELLELPGSVESLANVGDKVEKLRGTVGSASDLSVVAAKEE